MIVATGAAHGQAQHNGTRCGNEVIQFVGSGAGVVLHDVLRTAGQIPGRDDGGGIVRPDLVACDLFAQKFVVRLVAVERIDHIVAIPPGERAIFVALEAAAVSVSRQIEPVSSPPLAITGTCQQAINHFCPRRFADLSLTNASTSSGVGGRPIKSI